jgi:hypothetical protein
MAETTTPKKRAAPSNTVLIAAVVMGLCGMAVMNAIAQKLDPAEIERRQREAEQKAAEEQMKKAQAEATNGAKKPVPAGEGAGDAANALAAFGEEKILGKADGKTEVTIVWEWTPDIQADPNKILSAVNAAQAGVPDAKVRVVNADAKPGQAPGIYVNGKNVMSPMGDGSFPSVAEAYKQLANTVPPAP